MILAAGASTRMGSPKALLRDRHGTSFLTRLTRTLAAGGCDAALVVAGWHVSEIAVQLPEGALLVLNPDWTRGQLSSAKAGLRAALRLRPERVLMHLVDQPLICAADVRRVLEAAGTGIAVASWHGEPGHPLAFDAAIARAILSDRRSETLREALVRAGGQPRLVAGSSGCVKGANTPDELARLLPRRIRGR